MSSSETASQSKWRALYALRERIVVFISQLEKRTRLFPPPFHRHTVGGDNAIDQLQIQHSETISKCTGEYIVGVFNKGDSIASGSTATLLCNCPGWMLTQPEYAELNNEEHENMDALYGIGVSLKCFVQKHWNDKWNPAWKEMDWVLLGDPVTTGANLNTLSGINGMTYNCEFRINYSSDIKLQTSDGRYAIRSDMVTIHKQKTAAIATGSELFIPYDNLIKEKEEVMQERLNPS
jgi:hypothetical protein